MLYYLSQSAQQNLNQRLYSFVNRDTGERFQIKGYKGCEYLFQLVSNVGKAVTVLELFFGEKGVLTQNNTRIKTLLDSVYQDYYYLSVISPIFDSKTIREVKQELCRIIDRQAEAEANNDHKRADDLQERKEFLIDCLTRILQ